MTLGKPIANQGQERVNLVVILCLLLVSKVNWYPYANCQSAQVKWQLSLWQNDRCFLLSRVRLNFAKYKPCIFAIEPIFKRDSSLNFARGQLAANKISSLHSEGYDISNWAALLKDRVKKTFKVHLVIFKTQEYTLSPKVYKFEGSLTDGHIKSLLATALVPNETENKSLQSIE